LDEEILNEYNYISNNLDKDIVIVTNIFKWCEKSVDFLGTITFESGLVTT
jgi:hypothetical protein